VGGGQVCVSSPGFPGFIILVLVLQDVLKKSLLLEGIIQFP
jgi:hypothetical protein